MAEGNGKSLVRVWNVSLKNGSIIKVATIEQGERKPSMCEGCSAPCCKGKLAPVLNSEEFLSRKFKFRYSAVPPWLKEQVPNVEYLATLDIHPTKGCSYFNWETNRCTIWSDCPKSCKVYDCREDSRLEIRKFAKLREREWRKIHGRNCND